MKPLKKANSQQDRNQELSENNDRDKMLLFMLLSFLAWGYWESLTRAEKDFFLSMLLLIVVLLTSIFAWVYAKFYSKTAKKQKLLRESQDLIPDMLKMPSANSCYLGIDEDLQLPVYLPDSIRSRHVHIIGATGSGKTVSTVFNLIAQDTEHGHPIVILDAKGDIDFLNYLENLELGDKLKVFDLSDENSPFGYDPLESGSASEAAQRLFNSLTWSEEYYKNKSRTVLKFLVEVLAKKEGKNPSLVRLNECLLNLGLLNLALETNPDDKPKISAKDFEGISGLRDQIAQLVSGPLAKILSPGSGPRIDLSKDIKAQKVIYFRLPSLLDGETCRIVSQLIINDLSNFAGNAQRSGKDSIFCPVILDEFASFICPQFLDLISKARSAGLALHFSHQSMGDISKHDPEFVKCLVDNSSTRIVLRTYDPDTTELLSRCYGSKDERKLTFQVEGEEDDVALTEKGTLRDVQAFNVHPSQIKSLATGDGFVGIAHGLKHKGGGTSIFRVSFPHPKVPTKKPLNKTLNSKKGHIPMKILTLFLTITTLSGCATKTRSLTLGGASGVAIGAYTGSAVYAGPKNQIKTRNTIAGAGIGLAVGLLVSHYLNNHVEERMQLLRLKNDERLHFGDLPPSPFQAGPYFEANGMPKERSK